MAKDPAFLFYPGDYLRDTQNLSEKSQVAYDRIMCEHMRNICKDMSNIIVSKKQVEFFMKRLNEDERQEILFILTPVGEDFQIEWVAESIAKRKAYSDSRRENRASHTTKKSKKISSSYDSHMENEDVIENEDVNGNEDVVEIWPTFDDFWTLYDKKVGEKGKISKKWDKLSQRDREEIMNYLPHYIISQPDKQFRKNPETFLNNKSWNDEIIKSNGSERLTDQQRQYLVSRTDI